MGYKSLAQILARHNRPVSSNVSHHKRHTVQYSASSKSRPSEISARFGRKIPKQPSLLAFAFVHEGVNSNEVSCWLALRAGVLRRPAGQSATAQERRDDTNAIAVSLGSRGVSPKWKSSAPTSERSANSHKSAGRNSPNPQQNLLLLAGIARPKVHAYQTGSITRGSDG